MAKQIIVIFGNQLVADHPALEAYPEAEIVMIEADDLCRKRRYHKHKLILVLASMREYRDSLIKRGRTVSYVEYKKDSTFKAELTKQLNDAKKVVWMQTPDRGPNRLVGLLAEKSNITHDMLTSTQFLTSPSEFGSWLDNQKSNAPRMETFYHWQRKRLDILMDGNQPAGGEWNYDKENRKPLPKKLPMIPSLPPIARTTHVKDVTELIDYHFYDNPGSTDTFWLPTTRGESLHWLNTFIDERLELFGDYEDAMREDQPFLYHSVISPLLNLGLLTPNEIIKKIVASYESGAAPLNSVEGYVRQIIGWREFMFGLYWHKEDSFHKNIFGFDKPLESWWYSGKTKEANLPLPVERCLKSVHIYGYSHHIERLMVFGNWFLLDSYDPRSVYEWFMSLYVDAYEWVMIPNVLGMSQYADGRMLASKPYVSGSNYLQKMGSWWDSSQSAKESIMAQKYWDFLYDNRHTFANNQRMSLAIRQAEQRHKNTS